MGVTNQEWIKRSRKKGKDSQKTILAQALQRPMTGSELLAAMRKNCPKIQLRDVTHLLREFEERKLIRCLTPKEVTGRYYFFTDNGRRLVRKVFGLSVKPLPRLINWPAYAQVQRSEVRKLVLLELNMPWEAKGKTVTTLRKQLNPKYPIALNAVIRAMHQLKRSNLIRQIGETKKRSRPLYLPTLIGRRIITLLSKENRDAESSDGKALLSSSSPKKHEEEN